MEHVKHGNEDHFSYDNNNLGREKEKDNTPLTSAFQQNMILYGINTPACAIYLVTKPEFSIGYSSDCDAVLSFSREISRHHAKILWKNEEYEIQDLGSTNHTSVNGKVLSPNQPHRLQNADRVSFASYVFEVRIIHF